MKPVKLSRYSIFIPLDDEITLAFNAAAGSFAVLESCNHRAITSSSGEDLNGTLPSHLLIDLYHGGFAVDARLDETALLRINSMFARTRSDSLLLTIVPSMGCNLACEYCYQAANERPGVMDSRIQQAVIDHLTTTLSAGRLRRVHITWYGGEPLLFWDIIRELGSRIGELCSAHSVALTSNMVTNGTLLTTGRAEEMAQLKIRTCQITLDGPRCVHDRRRPYRSGEGSFADIVDNLRALRGGPLSINLRTNVDRTNAESTQQLVEEIRDLSGWYPLTLAQTIAFPGCGCSYPSQHAFSMTEFARVVLGSRAILRQSGFLSTVPPAPRLHVCGADRANAFLVDASGTLYKCWNDIGMTDRSLGHISHPMAVNTPAMVYYLGWDPFSDPECSQCSHLPLCMGGCPSKPALGLDSSGGRDCSLIRYTLNEELKDCFLAGGGFPSPAPRRTGAVGRGDSR